jgi:hypothetical protein
MFKVKLGRVVQVYNPSFLGDRSRNISVQGQPGQKHETLPETQTKAKGLGAWLKW